MTPYTLIFDAFLARLPDDEIWEDEDFDIMQEDWVQLLNMAIARFKFPRKNLNNRNEKGFEDELGNSEIQVLAMFMKAELVSRNISAWGDTALLYDEKDYSPANFLDKLNDVLTATEAKAKDLERIYYRSIEGKPYPYQNWAGG